MAFYLVKILFYQKKFKTDLGISLDGDADRIILTDEKANIVDGDKIIAVLAERWKRKKILRGGVIGTLMSNYGLENFFKKNGIKFLRSNVGDRYVKEKMKKNKFNLKDINYGGGNIKPSMWGYKTPSKSKKRK